MGSEMCIRDSYCIGDSPCIDSLETMIEKAIEDGVCPVGAVENQLEELTAIKMIGLAIADAFNPCELAVLLILLAAILTRYPTQRKKALSAGILFTAAIYLCYFVFGTLIILGFKSLTAVTSFSTGWIYKGLGLFAIILGVLNLKDFIKPGSLGFIMEVPMSWRPKMKALLKSATSPKGAFCCWIILLILFNTLHCRTLFCGCRNIVRRQLGIGNPLADSL